MGSTDELCAIAALVAASEVFFFFRPQDMGGEEHFTA
jgi:hypothetical protein